MDYDIEKVSPRPWCQGMVFRSNPELRNWSPAGIAVANEREQIHIFSNMSGMDFGKSRILVGSVPEYTLNWEDNLHHIVHCVNEHEALEADRKRLKAIEGIIKDNSTGGRELLGRFHYYPNAPHGKEWCWYSMKDGLASHRSFGSFNEALDAAMKESEGGA